MIAEYDKDGALIFNYLYVGNSRMARFNSGAREYYVNDIRGSVVKVISSAGAVSASFEYEPFGSISQASGNPVEFNYTGKEFDDAYSFNLYYYGARYYNAELGRFISPDPVREYLNPYSYVGNEPVMMVDPDGRFAGGIIQWIWTHPDEFKHALEILNHLAIDAYENRDAITDAANFYYEFYRDGLISISGPGGSCYGCGIGYPSWD